MINLWIICCLLFRVALCIPFTLPVSDTASLGSCLWLVLVSTLGNSHKLPISAVMSMSGPMGRSPFAAGLWLGDMHFRFARLRLWWFWLRPLILLFVSEKSNLVLLEAYFQDYALCRSLIALCPYLTDQTPLISKNAPYFRLSRNTEHCRNCLQRGVWVTVLTNGGWSSKSCEPCGPS